jgi:hypothetical protein
MEKTMLMRHILYFVVVVSLAVAVGCSTTSEKKAAAQLPSNESKTQPAGQALADITDIKDLVAQLRLTTNPHVLASARYLTDNTAGLKSIQTQALKSRDDLTKAAKSGEDLRIEAYPLRAALWANPVVETCWENPSENFQAQMSRVQQAIGDTWQAASKLRFTGWRQCPPTSANNQQVIRIQIDDSDPNNGPRTLGLGKQLAGVPHGMLLNFTFLRWGTGCQTMTDYCIKAIAVHEFGHAIGFAHEQNRPDKPGECMEPPQGSSGDVLLTPYDPNSVMNYCNKKYNNDGQLSDLDKQAVQLLYGLP